MKELSLITPTEELF
jgi:hypothetical protein